MSIPNLETVLAAYIECALWSTTCTDTCGEEGPLEDFYRSDDIAPESHTRMREDCAAFILEAGVLLADWDDGQVGHDFWLTRNHHGAGFWDRGMVTGDALTELAHGYGSQDLYVGDDGQLHIS